MLSICLALLRHLGIERAHVVGRRLMWVQAERQAGVDPVLMEIPEAIPV
jgi:hypothetical protein